ncbi:MAG: carboxypeptidase regulatory-like domain-containing protein [Planctomycetes bacterium]|nr:carboxypeptidase regulatory-like domain-containing protein [Planctomycetota bacterium]
MRKIVIPLAVAFVVVSAAIAWMAFSRQRPRYDATGAARSTQKPEVTAALDLVGGGGAEAVPGGSSEAGGTEAAAGEATLHGVVTDEDGEPVPGAHVLVLAGRENLADGLERERTLRRRLLGKEDPHAAGSLVAQAKAGPDGRYAIPVASIPRGDHAVMARKPPAAPGKERWQWTSEGSEVDLRLGPGDTIAGVVLAPDGKPQAGAAVEAYVEEEEGFQRFGFLFGPGQGDDPADRAATSDDGTFLLAVSPGRYRVSASAPGTTPETVRGVESGTQDLEILLGPGHGIAGRVVDESGAPVAGARVSLTGGFGRSFDRGGFDRGGFGRGPGGGPGGGFGGGGRGGPGGPGDDGRGGARRFLSRLQRPLARVETGADGRFELEGIGPAEYVVLAEKPGRVPAGAEVEVGDDLEVHRVELVLQPGKVIAGVVTGPNGDPVQGAFVAVAERRGGEGSGFARGRGGRGPGGDGGRGPGGEGGRGPGGEGARGPGGDGGRSPGGESGPGAERGGADRPQEPRRDPISLFGAAAAAETDEDGRFTFDTLAAGKYALSAQAEDLVPHREEEVDLQDRVELAISLEAGGRLEGKVVSSADASPVTGARMRFRVSDQDDREVVSGEDGKYSIGGLYGLDIDEVRVTAKGFTILATEKLETPGPGDALARDFALDPAARLAGTVTDVEGTPVPRARVTIAPVVEEGEGGDPRDFQRRRQAAVQASTARTDEQGRFVLAQVNAGPSLRVTVQHAEFKRFQSDPFSVSPGATAEDLRFQLHAGGKLEVLVVDTAGGPVPQARVRISEAREPGGEAAAQGAAPGTATPAAAQGPGRPGGPGFGRRFGGDRGRSSTRSTGPDGKARFTGLNGGEYDLSVTKTGYQPLDSRTAVVEDQGASLTVRLLPENVIAGRVLESSGAPVQGAAVQAVPPGQPFGGQGAQSDAQGAFRVGSLGPGPYSLNVRAEGYARKSLPQVEVNAPVEITLVRLGGIAGRVVAVETGMPVTRFQVRMRTDARPSQGEGEDRRRGPGSFFEGRGRGGERRGFDDPLGAFAWSGIDPGSYLLEVAAEGHTGAEVRVQVDEGLVTEGIEVQLIEGLSVSGQVVTKGTALPVEGASIYLLPLSERRAEEGDERTMRERREERRYARRERLEDRREREPGEGRLRGEGSVEAAAAELASAALKAALRGGSSLAVTDGAGAFQLREVPLGRYVLVANHEAFVPARVEVAIGDVARSVRVELAEGEELTGSVSLPDGSGAAGAVVMVRDKSGTVKRAQADAAGRYAVRGLAPGSYTFSVRTSQTGRSVASGSVDLAIEKGTNRYDHKLQEGTQ